jgi:TrpR family trp operon transcriptional repressor
MAVPAHHYKDLLQLIIAIETEKEAKKILSDLLTPQELESLTERWQIIKALAKGKTQREIAQHLKISIAKVSRGSRILQYGSGGFEYFLKKLGKTAKGES